MEQKTLMEDRKNTGFPNQKSPVAPCQKPATLVVGTSLWQFQIITHYTNFPFLKIGISIPSCVYPVAHRSSVPNIKSICCMERFTPLFFT